MIAVTLTGSLVLPAAVIVAMIVWIVGTVVNDWQNLR